MNLFDSSEIQSAISTVNEEKAKLEKSIKNCGAYLTGLIEMKAALSVAGTIERV